MLHGFNTLRFEATPDGDFATGGMPEHTGLTPEGVAPPAVEPEPAWEGVSQEDWEAQQQFVAQAQEMLQRLAPVADYMQQVPGPEQFGQQQQGEPFDIFADNSEEQIRRMIREETAPYAEVVQARQLEELEGRARDMIGDTESRLGELMRPAYEEGQRGLDPGDLVLQFAQAYSPEMVQKYGPGVRADEAAIEMAYEQVKTYQEALLQASQQRDFNQASTLSSAPREPAGAGVASQPLVTTQPGGIAAFKERWGLE